MSLSVVMCVCVCVCVRVCACVCVLIINKYAKKCFDGFLAHPVRRTR